MLSEVKRTPRERIIKLIGEAINHPLVQNSGYAPLINTLVKPAIGRELRKLTDEQAQQLIEKVRAELLDA